VGGGISGLALAYRLGQEAPDAKIHVLEEGDRVGGKVWSERKNGFLIEHGPNGFLDSKSSTLELCRSLGLGNALVPASDAARQNRYLFRGHGLERLPNSFMAFLRSPVLGWRGKASILAERFRPPSRTTEDESIDAFVRRRLGAEVAVDLADAFVTGIFAGDPKLLSLPAALPRLAALEREHGSIFRGMSSGKRQRRREARRQGVPLPGPQRMWSFPNGLRTLVDGLAAQLREPPQLLTRVNGLVPPGQDRTNWLVALQGRNVGSADVVALTCPAFEQSRLVRAFDIDLAERIGAISYTPVIVAALGYRQADVPRSLDGFGYLTPQRLRRDVLGVQWCSSIFPERAESGCVLVRALCGGWNRQDIAGWDDERILGAIREELRQALGVSAVPVFSQVIHWPKALPQYHLGHQERVAWIMQRSRRYPGLFLAGNSYGGVSLNDCTERAQELACQIAQFLREPRKGIGAPT
jgi:protoporphyrinogen/coproporphyrinogen III oxidase